MNQTDITAATPAVLARQLGDSLAEHANRLTVLHAHMTRSDGGVELAELIVGLWTLVGSSYRTADDLHDAGAVV